MSDIEQCREAYREIYRAMIAKDADALDGSFVPVHMTGMRQDKRAFFQNCAKASNRRESSSRLF